MSYWQPAARFAGVIDVSHHDGPIKWSQVPPNIRLVFIKATQGAGYVDPAFAANIDGALDTGRLVVPYHFLTEDPIADQLENFRRNGALADGVPAMIDWEVDPAHSRRPPTATMEGFGTALAAVIKRPPVAYHGMYDLSSPIINAWPWMVPKYGPQPQGPQWLLWQDRDDLIVPGIPEKCDHSVFAGTEDELAAWFKTGALPAGFDQDTVAVAVKTQRATVVSDVDAAIRALQTALQLDGEYKGAIDGDFGIGSRAALAVWYAKQE